MSETYSRKGYMALKKETTENTAVVPNVFVPFNDESVAVDYSYTPAVPISGSRSVNRRAVLNKIPAPAGVININVEPKTIGYFLEAIFGDLTTGNYVTISNISGTFNTTNLVTFVGSGATATPVFVGDNFILFGAYTGTPVATDTLSQAVSGATADVDLVDATAVVKGHAAKLPAEFSNTFTVEFGLADRAHRYIGCKFHSIDALGQSDNIITAGIQMMARSAFRHAKCNAATAGSAVATTVDTTQGLVTGDTVKVFRPSTGAFIDLSGVGGKTTTVTVTSTTVATLATVTDNILLGDLLMLAPQTPSYTIDSEFPWSGGAQVSVGATKDSFATENVEDFSMVIASELEERHAATGTGIANRFPVALLQKGLTGNGSFKMYNQNEEFIGKMRLNTASAIKLRCEGGQIAALGINYAFEIIYPEVQFDAYQLSLSADDLVEEEIPFTALHNTSAAYLAQVLLVNNVASY